MKKYLFIPILLFFSGCTTDISNYLPKEKQTVVKKMRYVKIDPKKEPTFEKDFLRVAYKTKEDPNYTRLGLTKDDKEWFKTITYMLWNRDISKYQYIQEGLTRYPTHKYEFNFVANNI